MTRAKDISKILTDADISGTLDVTGETTLATHLNLGDNDTIKLGANADLSIFHDGSNSHIVDSGTGNLNISATNFNVYNAGGTEQKIGATTDGAVDLYHNGSKKFETTSSGVNITGTLAVVDDVSIQGATPTLSLADTDVSNNKVEFNYDEFLTIDIDPNNARGNTGLIIKGDGSERMRIDSSGNIGIGTNSPDTKIQIKGSTNSDQLTLGGTDNRGLKISTTNIGGQNDSSVIYDAQDTESSGANSTHIFKTGGTERMRIDGSGRVGVGVSSLSLHQMAVHGATGGNATFKVANTSTSGNTTTYLSFMDGSGANSVNSAHFQGFNGANNHYLLGNGTTTFTSDEIAKKNIETTRDGYLEDLAKLRVVKYNWKEDEDGTDKELGLIAQEVEKVFPKLVMLDIDPQIEDKDKKKMIKLSVLPLMLLKALQEANTKITALEARITALESA